MNATSIVAPVFIEIYSGPNTVFSGRTFQMNGGGVAFCHLPLHVKTPLGYRPIDEHNPALGYLLFSQHEGVTYFLTGTTSEYHSGTGAGPVLAMSPHVQEALPIHLGFVPGIATVSLRHAGLGSFTLDTRGYGISFQPAMPENRPPLFQHFRYKIIRESVLIRSVATRQVLTCVDARPGALVTNMPDSGSEKRLWQIDDLNQQIIHQATGCVLDIDSGRHAKLCINPPQVGKDSQHWVLRGDYLVCRKDNLVGTGHDMVSNVTAEPKDQNGSDFQKWRFDLPSRLEAPAAP